MILSRNQRAALAAAEAHRIFMARHGVTRAGVKLWSEEEVRLLRSLYPDYCALVAAIPGRTRKAIETKAAKLQISKSRRIWCEPEFQTMREPYQGGTPVSEIVTLLDRKSPTQVYGKAARRRVRRPRRPPKATGYPVLDAIRTRAHAMRISLRELDEDTGGGVYFVAPRRIDWKRVQRALTVLGGQAKLQW
jgi:hypothetical protein